LGKLENDVIGGPKKGAGLLTYLRYNMWLDAETLNPLMNKSYTQEQIDGLVEMSNAASRFELYDIGSKAASNSSKKRNILLINLNLPLFSYFILFTAFWNYYGCFCCVTHLYVRQFYELNVKHLKPNANKLR
jgi:hypothetical protein